MDLLLNKYVWAVLLEIAVAVFVGIKGYSLGESAVQAKFDEFVDRQTQLELENEQAARAKEHAMQAENEKVTDKYAALKKTTGLAVSRLDAERVRLQADLDEYRTASNSAAVGRTDDDPRNIVLAECFDRYGAVARAAAEEADKITGLQSFITAVVPK